MEYDIIGDIHGHADKLVALLRSLGYVERQGAWQHPTRSTVFVGDFIDRGPGQLATLDIVRRMVNAGSAQAVLGNHEFNAICWFFPDPDKEGSHLRPRSEKNRHQHQAFLTEVEHDPIRHKDIIHWFLQLPLFLELPDIRVIHACWHQSYINSLNGLLGPGNCLTEELIVAASRKDSPIYEAIETLTKGTEIALPLGLSYQDKDGHVRTAVRTRWWDESARTYRSASLVDPDLREALPETMITESAQINYANDKPLFIGHYWRSGIPHPLTPKIACVDYSAGKGGPLVAYRWEGEDVLRADHFVAV